MPKEREPGEDTPDGQGFTSAQKPSIDVERDRAGGQKEKTKPAVPGETLLPPD